MTRNGTKKHALKKNTEIFRKSAFAEDVVSVFHPLISGAAVFRRWILDRIPKLAEETQDSAKPAIGEQMVPKFPGSGAFHWMVFDIPLMYPLASAACASYAASMQPTLETLGTGVNRYATLLTYFGSFGEVCGAWIPYAEISG